MSLTIKVFDCGHGCSFVSILYCRKLRTNATNANVAAITVTKTPKTLTFLLGLEEAILVLGLQVPKVIKTNDKINVLVHFA